MTIYGLLNLNAGSAIKRHCVRLLGFAVLIAIALPGLADEEPDGDPLPEEDTIFGTWYVQVMDGEVVDLDEQIGLVFDKKGVLRVIDGGEERETSRFTNDKQRSRVMLFEERDPTDIETIIRYTFVDDMVIFRITEDVGQGREGDVAVYELTRSREGSERHRRKREEAAGQ